MTQRVSVLLDADAAEMLVKLSGSPRRQGEYLSRLIRLAAAGEGGQTPEDLEDLRIQVRGMANELTAVASRLIAAASPRPAED